MKYFVYILFSKKDRGLYVGYTDDLRRRLKEHKSGKVKSTNKRLPFILIHQEIFDDRKDAMKRERFLKSLYSAKEKQKILRKFFSERLV